MCKPSSKEDGSLRMRKIMYGQMHARLGMSFDRSLHLLPGSFAPFRVLTV